VVLVSCVILARVSGEPFLASVSAKNYTVITLDGRRSNRTAKKAKELAAKGNHRWEGEFTLIELKPNSSNPDYARLFAPKLTIIPQILPPRSPEGLLLYYPHKDQRSARYAY
jgi:hypothetical protein